MGEETATRKSAFWEFSRRALMPTVQRLLPTPHNCRVVEIGPVDGLLMTAAAQFFGSVSGVRLLGGPRQLENVDWGGHNVTDADGLRLPLPAGSAEFIYSLRGMSPLRTLDEFRETVRECARVLSPGGVALFWFGRFSRLPFAPPGRAWLRGYEVRPDASTGAASLHIRMYHARKAVLNAGMRAVSLSTPLHPDTSWRLFRGGPDSYITAYKPVA